MIVAIGILCLYAMLAPTAGAVVAMYVVHKPSGGGHVDAENQLLRSIVARLRLTGRDREHAAYDLCTCHLTPDEAALFDAVTKDVE